NQAIPATSLVRLVQAALQLLVGHRPGSRVLGIPGLVLLLLGLTAVGDWADQVQTDLVGGEDGLDRVSGAIRLAPSRRRNVVPDLAGSLRLVVVRVFGLLAVGVLGGLQVGAADVGHGVVLLDRTDLVEE